MVPVRLKQSIDNFSGFAIIILVLDTQNRYLYQQGFATITERDKKIISDISEKYKAKRVLLFGSSVSSPERARDIDLAVEGIDPKDFFRYYGELLFSLSKPVDVIDLSQKTQFTELVRKEGTSVYG